MGGGAGELGDLVDATPDEIAPKLADRYLALKAAAVEATRANVRRLEELQGFAKVTAIVEALTERLLAVRTSPVRRERRILFDGKPAEIHPYDVTVERDGAGEAWDCR